MGWFTRIVMVLLLVFLDTWQWEIKTCGEYNIREFDFLAKPILS